MTSVQTDPNRVDPTVRELITSAANDMSTLVSAQIELAKAEVRESATRAAATFAVLVAAGVIGFLAVIFLLVTVAYVLVALGLPVWAGFGIVTLLLLIIAGVLALVGKAQAKKIKGPEHTIEQIEKTKAAFANSAGA